VNIGTSFPKYTAVHPAAATREPDHSRVSGFDGFFFTCLVFALSGCVDISTHRVK
jgi:hypothetical protein